MNDRENEDLLLKSKLEPKELQPSALQDADQPAEPGHRIVEQPFSFYNAQHDWRTWFGAIFTGVWLMLLAIYISGEVGWSKIGDVPMEILGSFLEGAFAPLAFLWFVLAYYSQQKELSQNTNAIKMQYVEIQKSAEQATIQAAAIKASEIHARKESFLRVSESVRRQLGAIMGYLYVSSQGATSTGLVTPEKMSDLWHSMGQSDPEIFSRQMLEVSFTHGERYGYRLMFGTPIRTRHTDNFIFNFERLLDAAEECDTNGMIRDSIKGGAHGFVYNRMIRLRDNPPDGFTLGVYDFDPDQIDE